MRLCEPGAWSPIRNIGFTDQSHLGQSRIALDLERWFRRRRWGRPGRAPPEVHEFSTSGSKQSVVARRGRASFRVHVSSPTQSLATEAVDCGRVPSTEPCGCSWAGRDQQTTILGNGCREGPAEGPCGCVGPQRDHDVTILVGWAEQRLDKTGAREIRGH